MPTTVEQRIRYALCCLVALMIAFLPPRTSAQAIGISATQAERIHTLRVEEAANLISSSFRFVKPGTLTVGMEAGYMPFAVIGPDNKTMVGCDPDLAQLIADSLGVKLEIFDVAWEDWPLAVQSGRFDAVMANVTVTEARKKKFDFSTYRNDILGFYVSIDSPIRAINAPKDIAGLKVTVDASTNQEQILLRWNRQNIAAGLKPAELLYYDDDAVRRLAIRSGRADIYLGANAQAAQEASLDHQTRLVGLISGGWPQSAEISVATRRDAGLADAITSAINVQIKNGNYAKVLARWNLTSEAIDRSRTNPPGLPEQ